MNIKRNISAYLVLAVSIISCSQVSYWKNRHFDYPYSPQPVEVQISKSTFSIYSYNYYGDIPQNSGFVDVRNATVVGDTIFAFNYQEVMDTFNNISIQRYIEYTFIKKSRKLYRIWPFMPYSIWRNDNSYLYEHDSSQINTSKLVKFDPTWEDWPWEYAYIDYGDIDAYRKGQNKRLRKRLSTSIERNNVTYWMYNYGGIYENDSIYRIKDNDSLGPLIFHPFKKRI